MIPAAMMCYSCREPEIDEFVFGSETVRAEILTEHPRVLRTDSSQRNRFVSGWKFERIDGVVTARAVKNRATFEIVQLEPRRRRIALKGVKPGDGTFVADVFARGQAIGRVDLGQAAEFTIPDSVGTGVIPVSLVLPPPTRLTLEQVLLFGPRPKGVVEFDGGSIRQSGWSTVQWTLKVGSSARLEGSFNPPTAPKPGQCFLIEADFEGTGPREMFRWCGDDPNPRPPINVEEDLGMDDALCQIRFVATGTGDPGSWDLRVESEKDTGSPWADAAPRRTPKAVVVYVLDALRADAVGFSGSEIARTPIMESLAREGVVFSNHFSVAPSTVPSTKSLFLGVPFLDGRGLPEPRPQTIAEAFREAGFRTGSFSSNPALAEDFGITDGFESVTYLELGESFDQGNRTTNDSAARVHQAVLDWVTTLGRNDRFFAYVHTLHPHNPYTPPVEVLSQFVDTEDPVPLGTTRELVDIRDGSIEATDLIRNRVRNAYAAGVTYNDALLGALVEAIENRVGPEELLLIVTADHGEELFDHGGVLHGYTLYDEMLSIPLVMRWPGVIKPGHVRSQTGTLDVNATLRTLVDPGSQERSSGGVPLWSQMGDHRNADLSGPVFAYAPAIPGTAVMGRLPGLKLVETQTNKRHTGMGFRLGRDFDGEYRFDLGADPEEMNNLGPTNDLAAEWLRTEMRWWRVQWESRALTKAGEELDEVTRRRLEVLGYVVD